jgi:sialate O-acetylesterase
MRHKHRILSLSTLLAVALSAGASAGDALKVHGIFSSNMVVQRDKPIKIWGWAKPGGKVAVQFGKEKAQAAADGKTGRWAVTFPAREADANGQKLTVTAGDETIEMDNIVIGDVWVMNGQSNMAFGLSKTYRADLEGATAHLPLLRGVRISPNEQYALQEDLPARAVSSWTVSSPQTAGGYSAIGYAFASRLQRALQIPIGIIDNARGGASIESLVPRQKFKDHPVAAKYLAWVEKRRADFDWDAAVQRLVDKWEKTVAQQREKGVPERRRLVLQRHVRRLQGPEHQGRSLPPGLQQRHGRKLPAEALPGAHEAHGRGLARGLQRPEPAGGRHRILRREHHAEP